ncbi:MAG: chaperone modulator CbpM [Elusimicrobia bacterium]|nr:chaperone modulator CbpM [Elusimicrobiota bacterium]
MKPGPEDLPRFHDLAALLEIESSFLEQCVRHGAVRLEAFAEDRAEFLPAQLARLRRLQRICLGLDIDVFAGGIIVDLLDRMDGLQCDLERLSARDRP